MTGAWVLGISLAALPLLLLVIGAILQNRLAAAFLRVEGAFSGIDVQLKRRHDLIPNLVEAVKGAMAHERTTLERAIEARRHAADSLRVATPIEPGDLPRREAELDGIVATILARVEAYPVLKTAANVLALQEELVTSENRVAFARHAYHDAVVRYHVLLRQVPSNLVASLLGYRAAAMLEWDRPTIEAVPSASIAAAVTAPEPRA